MVKRHRSSSDSVDEVDACDVLYRRTLRTLVSVAAQKAFPNRVLQGGHPIDGSFLFSFRDLKPVQTEEASAIEGKLLELVDADVPIEKREVPYGDALRYFQKHGMHASVTLLKSRVRPSVAAYLIGSATRLALFPLLSRTGQVRVRLPKFVTNGDNLLAVYHNPSGGSLESVVPSPTLLTSFRDHKAWGLKHGVRAVGELNALKAVGRELHDLVLHAEFRQEAKLSSIADIIAKANEAASTHKDRIGVICIAGPTSSGKTTFATKLSMYLANLGYHAVPLSVDHYYLPLDRQPKYQVRQLRSDVDYDSIEAMDVALVNEHVNALLRGTEVMTPVYNMKTGYRDEPGKRFQLQDPRHSILVLEGIHSLNPAYTTSITDSRVFRVYISPLSSLQLDETNAIRTTDHRLLRRMCRDYMFRGHTASKTLGMWDNVRRGEHKWIFPHQDQVDLVVNSAMEYEMRVLKPFVEPLLSMVAPDEPTFQKAQELLDLLGLFNSASSSLVPSTSLLREFIGDGVFDCH